MTESIDEADIKEGFLKACFNREMKKAAPNRCGFLLCGVFAARTDRGDASVRHGACPARFLLFQVHGQPGDDLGEEDDHHDADDLAADILEHALVDVDKFPVRYRAFNKVR